MEALLLSLLFALFASFGVGIGFCMGFLVSLAYGSYYYDRSERDGRRNWPALRGSSLWAPVRGYFSFQTVGLEEKLEDRSRPVIYACRPHGLFAFSCLLAFAVNPKSRVRCGVHRLIFWVPLLSDLAVWLGAFDVTKENIEGMLERGESVALVPGGAREMIPGVDPRSHRGFLRIAHEKGAPVVCVHFEGEQELFWTWRGLRDLRHAFADFMGYPFPSFFWGPLPRPLTTVAADQALDPADYPDCDAFIKAYDMAMDRLCGKQW